LNMLGQKVLELKNTSNAMELNVSNLAAGTYIMKVSVNGEVGTFKIVKN
ncbi:MAG TPA: hypothetical protein DCX41_02450, partial [Aequorivita sp.]|nr:hypothetical protein [Aequorivita sp.]